MKNNKTIKNPVINFTKCDKYKKCIEMCPNNTIILSYNICCAKSAKYCSVVEVPCYPQEIIFEYEQYDACGLCINACPEKAIF